MGDGGAEKLDGSFALALAVVQRFLRLVGDEGPNKWKVRPVAEFYFDGDEDGAEEEFAVLVRRV